MSCNDVSNVWLVTMLGVTETPVAGVPERGGNQRNKCLESVNHLRAAIEQECRCDGHEMSALSRALVQRSGSWWLREFFYQLLHEWEG